MKKEHVLQVLDRMEELISNELMGLCLASTHGCTKILNESLDFITYDECFDFYMSLKDYIRDKIRAHKPIITYDTLFYFPLNESGREDRLKIIHLIREEVKNENF